jgi:hypothetical protein
MGGRVYTLNIGSYEHAFSPDNGEHRLILERLTYDFPETLRWDFEQPGIHRAIAALWADELSDLRERGVKGCYANVHSPDAVAELLEYKQAREGGGLA